MAKIGLIDVDGHNFPNLALMRISAYHKSIGDDVEWWWSDFVHYDIVYKSKVFSDAYSKDIPDPMNADKIIKGGTGYCIELGEDGTEHFREETNLVLPKEVEDMFPDYSLYPQYDYAVSMTSRGCPRGCNFCHVQAKEGNRAIKQYDVSKFYAGQKKIKVLDPNITACKDRIELLEQYAETKAWCDFTQGIDARLLNEEFIEAMNKVKVEIVHFAWDDMRQSESVLKGLKLYSEIGKIKQNRYRAVYVLTNYDTTMEENLYRIYTLRDMGYDPFVMVYNRKNASKEIIKLQRWCNQKILFNVCKKFEDYDGKR